MCCLWELYASLQTFLGSRAFRDNAREIYYLKDEHECMSVGFKSPVSNINEFMCVYLALITKEKFHIVFLSELMSEQLLCVNLCVSSWNSSTVIYFIHVVRAGFSVKEIKAPPWGEHNLMFILLFIRAISS